MGIHGGKPMNETELGRRRVMQMRGSSFVNIPKFWTKYQRIEKGDIVSILLLEDGSLKISPAGAGAV